MKIVIQSLIASFVIHVILIVGGMAVGCIRTLNFKPEEIYSGERVDRL